MTKSVILVMHKVKRHTQHPGDSLMSLLLTVCTHVGTAASSLLLERFLPTRALLPGRRGLNSRLI